MRKVTQKQRKCWTVVQRFVEERGDAWTWSEVGEELGISASSANRRYNAAKAKLGDIKRAADPRSNESKLADRVGDWITEFSDPRLRSVAEVANEEGMEPAVIQKLIGALDKKYVRTASMVGDVKQEELQKLIRWGHFRIWESIVRMTDEEIDDVPLRDRAVAGGVLFDKDQLLQNKPTEIVRTQQEITEFTKLGAMLTREVERRAKANGQELVYDVDPDTGERRIIEVD